MRVLAGSLKPNPFAQHETSPRVSFTSLEEPSDQFIRSNDAKVLWQRLCALPQPTLCRGSDNRTHLMPDHPSVPDRTPQQKAEYSSIERLEAMIAFTSSHAEAATTVASKSETGKLYESFEADLNARFWFMANENPQVSKSLRFWNQGLFKRSTAFVFGPLIPCMKVLKLLDAYRAAFEPLKQAAQANEK